MAGPDAAATVVVVLPGTGLVGAWPALTLALGRGGVEATAVHDVGEALEALVSAGDADDAPCVLVDSTGLAPEEVAARLLAVRTTAPWAAPVVVAAEPDGPLALASLRAGAVDQVSPADPPGVIAAAARAAELQRDRRAQRRAITSLRSMVEDFLRVLVQAERRSIDLEHRLARQERPSAPMQAVAELDGDRVPCVFVVEADRRLADELVDDLETAGLTTFAFVSGEEAIATAERMAGRAEPVDLVLCDVALPGVDGLETIRQLRRLRPSLAALLLTAAADPAVAEAAADLGVAGLVCTPLQDRDTVVARVRDHARAAMARAREQLYLARIKQRHDHVLQRYRALAADLDRATKV